MSFSKIALGFSLLLTGILTFFYYPKWNKETTEATISWDVSGYYWYLPAFFIYEDVRQLGFSQSVIDKYRPTPSNLQSFTHDNQYQVLKYSMGQAISFFPAFWLAHKAAGWLDFPQDGFSLPYQFAIFLWGWLVTCIGLIYLRRILLRYFSETATGLTLLVLVFATNLLEYGFITNAMTHNFLFTYYAILIWCTLRFYEDARWKHAIGIGVCLGMMALTRPTEILAALIPIGFGLRFTWQECIGRLRFWLRQYEKVIVGLFLVGFIGSFQLLYWKFVSGDWLVYSYEDQGFSWTRPHVIDCLFSGRAGWLIYTPAMVLSLWGFYDLIKTRKALSGTLLIFSLLFFYVTFAWDIWWYGGSVSQRALVQAYPVLAFPLCAFFERLKKVNVAALITAGFLVFCVHYNCWMTHHCHYGGLFVAGDMTSEYLQAIFLRNDMPAEARKLLDTRKLYQKPIENPVYLMTPADTTSYLGSFCLSDTVQYSPGKKFALPQKTGWLRASGDFITHHKEWDAWKMTQLVLKYYKDGKELRSDVLRIQRHLDQDKETHLWLDSKLRYEPDSVQIYFWHADSKTSMCGQNISLLYHKGDE
jgi:hypothetical protein